MTKKNYIITGLIILLLMLLSVFFYHAGNILVEEQNPIWSDLIVVLMGSGVYYDLKRPRVRSFKATFTPK